MGSYGELESLAQEQALYPVPEAQSSQIDNRRVLRDLKQYRELYDMSIKDSDAFWDRHAHEFLTFQKDFKTNPDRIALVYEGDEPNQGRSITYGELLVEVCKTAKALQQLGVKKGHRVAVYMPMIPEGVITVLAINRLGAVHSLVFDGFSANALADRILDADARVVVTADHGQREGRFFPMKSVVDEAVRKCPLVEKVLVYQHSKETVPWAEGRDVWWHDTVEHASPHVEPEVMDSEDPLFILYTSGSTGKPKGLVHSTAGFLTGAAATGKYVFDMHPDDVFFCAGDIGWISGLVYALYAPLLIGCTTVVFGGIPTYPDQYRYWDICSQHHVTHFYTAPTTLRLLKKLTEGEIPRRMDSLRVLGSIGEPIAPEVWRWYRDIVGRRRAHVLDTYFQTETGSLVLTSLAGVTPTKPGSCTFPFFGIDAVILDPVSGKEVEGPAPSGVLAFRGSWPSIARTAWGDHERYMDTYLRPYPGYYFTGDGVRKDEDGYFWISGRVDDGVNVSGHLILTAEVESALLDYPHVAEVAVVGVDDEAAGQALVAFVVLRQSPQSSVPEPPIQTQLSDHLANRIGSFARPKSIYVVPDLPKTRSGKLTRRILRKILAGEMGSIGDTSTVVNVNAIYQVQDVVIQAARSSA
ncbi:acyl-activating enzyme [Aspergillus steynii IBT 23096]|uniref:Acetyl-coenzyme A synthetase n=1 Tax=Aspergillus steynii IBT 23096 TaxID=1392250 RepID=A0A2I2GNV4_9EURO|nr:acyl-activating enzyme [Aspergillus steynii IBT 23096]PLB54543.1 acyl-activating enzyme [Aspergillus steynii IBT 23096]